MAGYSTTPSYPFSSTPDFKLHMNSRTPEENHEWEQARLFEAREKALQEKMGQLETPRPFKSRKMMVREAADRLRAKMPAIVDIPGSDGVAEAVMKVKATMSKPVSMHIPEGETTAYISTRAKLKRNETNIVDLISDEYGLEQSEKFSTSIYGAKNITTKSKPAGPVEKLLPRYGEQQMYSRERATTYDTKLADQALKAKVKLESEAKGVAIVDLVSDENDIRTLPTSANLFTLYSPGYRARYITKESAPITEREKLRLQTQRESEARQKTGADSLRFHEMMKAKGKGKEEEKSKMVTLRLRRGFPDLPSIATPSYGDETIKESDPSTEEEKTRLEAIQRAVACGQLSYKDAMRAGAKAAKEAPMWKFESSMWDIGGDASDNDTTKSRSRTNSITNPTTNDTRSPTPLPTEAKDMRTEVSEPRVKMRAFTPAEEAKFAEEDRLEEEERKKEADKWCGGDWVML